MITAIKTELNEHTKYILSRKCFTCGIPANALRSAGMQIRLKAEDEQATVIHFMLNLYETHGNKWQTDLVEFFEEIVKVENEFNKNKILKKFTGGKTELNEHTRWILGLVNFRCYQYAHMIRALGYNISNKEMDEQAEVIHFFLNLYETHGYSWRNHFEKLLEECLKKTSN